MKRPFFILIRLLGCMAILLLLTGLFFGIFEKQDTAVLLGILGAVASGIYFCSIFIYWTITL